MNDIKDEYRCKKCTHKDSDHENDDKGQCLIDKCGCEGLI